MAGIILEGLFIKDDNANESVGVISTASAVNYLSVVNSATGNAVDLQAAGDDTNIGLKVTPKGTGTINLAGPVVLGTGGATVTKVLTASATWDPASIPDGDDLSTTITVTGAAVGDPCFASLSTLGTNDVLISAHVQAVDTVRVTLLNRSGGAFDAASGTLRAVVFKMS